jgi:hypothetical protein
LTAVIPPDNRAPGQAGHLEDHNDIADMLTALSQQVGQLASAVTAAPAVFKPAAPSGVSATSGAMMGLGALGAVPVVYTPSGTGHVWVSITCSVFVSTTPATVQLIGGRYGAGQSSAPVNGAAITGTPFGTGNYNSAVTDMTACPDTIAGGMPVAMQEILFLNPGTSYWIDLAVTPGSGNTTTPQNIVISVQELPS